MFNVLSYYLLPVHRVNEFGFCSCGNPDCGSPGKHPIAGGIYSAKKYDSLDSFKNKNVAIKLGDGLIVIDVDMKNGKNGELVLQELYEKLGELPETLLITTPSGGSHLYYTTSEYCKTDNRFIDRGIEFKSNGTYVLAPPSINNGSNYSIESDVKIAELPKIWVDYINNIEVIKNTISPNLQSIYGKEEIEYILNKYISPDVEEPIWHAIMMAIQDTYDNFELFNNWSAKGSKYDGYEGCLAKWNSNLKRKNRQIGAISIRTIMFHARKHPDFINPLHIMSDSISFIKNESVPLPEADGLIKELYDYFYYNAPAAYKEFAMGAALLVLSTVTQGGYKINMTLFCNLFIAAIGPSACGKDFYYSTIHKILQLVDPRLIMGNPQSAQGLHKDIFIFNSRSWILDEFQDWVAECNKNDHKRAVLSSIKKLKGTEMFLADSLLSKDYPAIIEPKLSIYWTGTREGYYKLLNSDTVSGGLLSRIIVLNIKKIGDIDTLKEKKDIPYSIINRLKRIHDVGVIQQEKDYKQSLNKWQGKWRDINKKDPVHHDHTAQTIADTNITLDLEAKTDYYAFEKMCRQEMKDLDDSADTGSIIARVPMNALIIAGLHALGCGSTVISHADWIFGKNFVLAVTEFQKESVRENSGDTEQQKITRALLDFKSKNIDKLITYKELCTNGPRVVQKSNKKVLQECLNELSMQEEIILLSKDNIVIDRTQKGFRIKF